jgi:drug/metabolite transporter (DMT)-like permease
MDAIIIAPNLAPSNQTETELNLLAATQTALITPTTTQVPVTVVQKTTPVGQNKRLGYIFAACATFCWSGTGIFIDAISSQYPNATPLQLSFWRTALIAVGMGLFLLKGNKQQRVANFRFSKSEIGLYLVYGVIGVGVFNLTWSNSVAINKAAVATALLYCAPVFVVIGARFLFNERIRILSIAAIVIDLTGVFLVSDTYDLGALTNNMAGLMFALGSGLTFAIYTLCSKLSQRSAMSSLFYTFTFALVGLLVWGLWQEGLGLFVPALDWWGWLLLFFLSFGPTLGGYAFFNLSLQHLEAGVASVFTTLEPPIAAILAWLVLSRTMSILQWGGAFLIVGGVLILQLGERNSQKKAPELVS